MFAFILKECSVHCSVQDTSEHSQNFIIDSCIFVELCSYLIEINSLLWKSTTLSNFALVPVFFKAKSVIYSWQRTEWDRVLAYTACFYVSCVPGEYYIDVYRLGHGVYRVEELN